MKIVKTSRVVQAVHCTRRALKSLGISATSRLHRNGANAVSAQLEEAFTLLILFQIGLLDAKATIEHHKCSIVVMSVPDAIATTQTDDAFQALNVLKTLIGEKGTVCLLAKSAVFVKTDTALFSFACDLGGRENTPKVLAAFAGGLIASLYHGQRLEMAVEAGCRNAVSASMSKGSAFGFLGWVEIESDTFQIGDRVVHQDLAQPPENEKSNKNNDRFPIAFAATGVAMSGLLIGVNIGRVLVS